MNELTLVSIMKDEGDAPLEWVAFHRAVGISRSKAAALRDLAQKTQGGVVPDAASLVTMGDQEIIERGRGVPGRLGRSRRGARILSGTVVKSFCLGPAGWHSARRPLELAMSMATSGVAT